MATAIITTISERDTSRIAGLMCKNRVVLKPVGVEGNGGGRATLKFNREYLSKDKFHRIVSLGQDSRFRAKETVPQSRENLSPRFGC